MSENEKQIEMAKMLELHELALSNLYLVFKRLFPEHEDFWEEISLDEKSHATMIKTFRTMMEDGILAYSSRPFSVSDIEPYIEDIKNHANYAMKNKISMQEALATAMEMESRILEKDIFCPLVNDSEKLKKTLDSIVLETRKHHRAIKKMYNDIVE